LPNWIFLAALGVSNWIGVYAFIKLVRQVTINTTRRAQSSSIKAKLRISRQSIPQYTQAVNTPTPAVAEKVGIER
jgi:hypothetical protein